MSAQGDSFLEQPERDPVAQDAIEAVVKVFEKTRNELSLLGYPTLLHVFGPSEYVIRGAMPERHIFALIGPVTSPVDLWRQAGVRSRPSQP